MEETLTITDRDTTATLQLYWSRQHADLTFKESNSTGTQSKMMMKVSPEILRTIADQFYEWAETLESDQLNHPAPPPTHERKDATNEHP